MQLTSRASLDFPRASGPTSQKGGDEGASLNVQPLGSKECKIIRCGDRIGGNVSTEGGETKGKSDEKSTGSRGPQGDDACGVPVELAIDVLNMISVCRLNGTHNYLAGRSNDETDKGKYPVDDRDEDNLPVGVTSLSRISG